MIAQQLGLGFVTAVDPTQGQQSVIVVKGLIKLALIGTIMMALLWPGRFRLDALVRIDPAAMLSIIQSLSLQMLGAVVAVLALDRPQDSRGCRRPQHPDCGKPAARPALHATVEIDQEIPPEHYQAVAEVIGYVMRLNRAVARGRA